MTMRGKRFEDMSIQERESMFSRSEVKEFVTRAREVISNRRAVGNTELIYPGDHAAYAEPDRIRDIEIVKVYKP